MERGIESCRSEETLRYQNRYRTPTRAHACSSHRFRCIDLLSLELRERNIFARLTNAGPAQAVMDGATRTGNLGHSRPAQFPAPGREVRVNEHSHRMFCCCLPLRAFPSAEHSMRISFDLPASGREAARAASVTATGNLKFEIAAEPTVTVPDSHDHARKRHTVTVGGPTGMSRPGEGTR